MHQRCIRLKGTGLVVPMVQWPWQPMRPCPGTLHCNFKPLQLPTVGGGGVHSAQVVHAFTKPVATGLQEGQAGGASQGEASANPSSRGNC